MKTGAVAVLDALGFKGIWERFSPDDVLAKMKRLSDVAASASELVTQNFQQSNLIHWKAEEVIKTDTLVASFSDSLVLCCVGSPGPRFEDAPRTISETDALALFSLNWIAFACSLIIAEAASTEPTFVYRGAVATGGCLFDQPSFVLGPAIDEAAPQERLAEAGLVFFCESARSLIGRAPLRYMPMVEDYPVPMKTGSSFTTCVVNPFSFLPMIGRSVRRDRVKERTYVALAQLSSRILGYFDVTKPGVLGKKRNTEAFLNFAAGKIHFAPTD